MNDATTIAPVTLEQLRARLLDPNVSERDLRSYFIVDPEQSAPFSPRLAINPDTVMVTAADPATRSDAVLGLANWVARKRREQSFHERLDQGYQGPIIVSEGDSWFQYPFILDDVIDQLLPSYAIMSLDAGGDTLENMFADKEYIGAIAETGASILLLSGGGNDLLAGGDLERHLRGYDPALTPAQHLLPSFDQLVTQSIQIYDRIFREVEQRFPGVAIITHGYDRPVPVTDGRWLGTPMQNKGIADPGVQQALAAEMMNRFNAEMLRLASMYAHVDFVDGRGTVGDARWHDELHPTDEGFRDVSFGFRDAIQARVVPARAASPSSRARATRQARREPPRVAPPPPSSTRRGISLHIGLNTVDPAHYAGWDGQLTACEYDAEDMEQIAQAAGYQTTKLITPAATRAAVREAILTAADTLVGGEIFFVSYSGHGGQVPDFNRDELDDQADETWCLYDGQLIDDELYELWTRFKDNVRVLVVSDSCHSGTVIKRMEQAGAAAVPSLTAATDGVTRVRAMPAQVAARVFRNNRAFYRTVAEQIRTVEPGRLPKELSTPLRCTVRLLSGCLDPQFSYDGVANGLFTGTLLEVWKEGHFAGRYDQFVTEIQKRMPANQTPNHWVVGQPNPAFDGQRPFQI